MHLVENAFDLRTLPANEKETGTTLCSISTFFATAVQILSRSPLPIDLIIYLRKSTNFFIINLQRELVSCIANTPLLSLDSFFD